MAFQREEGDPARRPHPAAVCESVALQSVPRPPVVYTMSFVSDQVSSLQVETAACAMQSLEGSGFFILGDGTGVGKGRTIALVISEWLSTREGAYVTWVSANARLCEQAAAEFVTLGFAPPPEQYEFVSYGSLVSRARRAPAAAVRACSSSLVVLDECHVLRNMRKAYDAVQTLLLGGRARTAALYVSATVMSDVKHVRYLPLSAMVTSGPEATFGCDDEFRRALATGGAPFLELFCMHLKGRGMYCARQLSDACVGLSTVTVRPSVAHERLYDAMVEHLRQQHAGAIGHRALQRVLVAFKLPTAIELARRQLAAGKQVIFTLCSTGDAAAQRAIRCGRSGPVPSAADVLDTVCDLPLDPVDALVEEFGAGAVAELTGRVQRFVRANARAPWRVERVPHGEAAAFQSGAKRVAVLSRAGGLGLSLNDTGSGQRHVIVLEFPWSCEDFAQQIGRAHRTSNRTAPQYTVVVTSMPCEQRVLHSLLRRTISMGALTKGDGYASDAVCLRDHARAPTTAATRRALALKVTMQRGAHALGATADDILALPVHIRAFHRWWGHRPPAEILNQMLHAACGAMAVLTAGAAHAAPGDVEWQSQREALWTTLCHMRFFVPSCVVPAMRRWCPDAHGSFGPQVHRWVMAVLLAHAHADASSTLGRVPHDVMQRIIAIALWEGDDVALASDYLRTSPALLATVGHESFMNECVLMPSNAQRALLRVTDEVGWTDAPPATASKQRLLTELAREWAGPGVHTEVAAVDGDAHANYSVTLSYTVEQVAPPPAGAAFWLNVRSGQASWSTGEDATHATTFNGVRTSLDTSMFAPTTRTEYERQRARWVTGVQKRIVHLERHVRVATLHAMRLWHDSRKKLVRFAAPGGAEGYIVGLLL